MKIAIVGTGAMGSVYAGLFGDSGHEVWAIDRWREHIQAIAASGLRVEGASGDRVARIQATTDAREAGVCDLVVIATKAYDVEMAARDSRPLIGADTVVLTIQNGLGSPERVAEILGADRVTIGVVGGFGASIPEPGHVHHNGWELVRLGELAGGLSPRVEALAEMWRGAGFSVRAFENPHQLIWEKFVCNVCYSGPCAVTGKTIGEVMACPDTWQVASGCAAEAHAVAVARGVPIEIDDPVAYVREFGSKIPNAKPSMLLDHLAKRRSEIDAINGAVSPVAREHGLSAPYNEVVSALVRAAERGYSDA